MPLDHTDDKSTLVQVMAWCRQATSHYLSQCWPRSMPPNGVTRPQWVNWHVFPTWWHGNAFLWGGSTGDQWSLVDSPLHRASNTDIEYFLCCSTEQTFEQRVELSVIWEAMMLMRHHCHAMLQDIARSHWSFSVTSSTLHCLGQWAMSIPAGYTIITGVLRLHNQYLVCAIFIVPIIITCYGCDDISLQRNKNSLDFRIP